MREQQPDELVIRFADDREFLMSRENATLFTHMGNLATRNHVFLVTGEETEGTIEGTYVFAHAETYQPLVSFMLTHQFPMVLNKNEVSTCDETAFQRSLDQLSQQAGSDVPDFLPDEWEQA